MEQQQRTILYVDDAPEMLALGRQVFGDEGFAVETASTGAEAEEQIGRIRPDMVLMDLQLPDIDGLMLCTRLLSRCPSAPIVVVSASARMSDRILSLKLGADDFVSKPFDSYELVARVQAVLRRARRPIPTAPPLPEIQPIHVGALTIDVRRRSVIVSGERVHLTPSELKMLTTLASEPGRVFSREELAAALGLEHIDGSRSIDVHKRRIAKKLAEHPEAPAIETHQSFGYSLSES